MKYFLLCAVILCAASFSKSQVVPVCNSAKWKNGFTENIGQVKDQNGIPNKNIRYMYSEGDFSLALWSNGFSYEFHSAKPGPGKLSESQLINDDDPDKEDDQISINSSRIDVLLLGANHNPYIEVADPLPGVLNFYGSTKAKDEFLGVKAYKKIVYKNIYDGIDLEFAFRQQFKYAPLEYRFVVHPGADPSQIRMKYNGSRFLTISPNGDLTIGAALGEVSERGLYAFNGETNQPANCRYRIHNGNAVTFDILPAEKNTLIIDPEIEFGTYYGGKGSENWDTESEIRIDLEGNIVLSGSTTSIANIATSGAYQTTFGGNRDMFLAKFSSDATTLIFGTYYGGTGKESSYAIDIDTSNNIIMAGLAHSPNLATAGSYQSTMAGTGDALIAKFSTTGLLLWATYLGGSPDSESEHVRSVQNTSNNEIYMCGYLTSPGVATPGSFKPTYGGGGDAFIAKFNGSGFPVWITYWGGIGKDRAHNVLVEGGNLYVNGTANSKTGMATNGSYQKKGKGKDDDVLAKLDTAGHMIWATYFGGTGSEHGRGVVLDCDGNVYIDGWTNSKTDIATPGSYQPYKDTLSGALNDDGYIAKFDADGHRIWSTYFGGEASDDIFHLINDEEANLYFCGKTGSHLHIATPGSFQPVKKQKSDGFIGKMNKNGELQWCTYFGGKGNDEIYDLELQENMLFFNMSSTSTDLPTTSGVYQPTIKGGVDLAIFKLMLEATCEDQLEPNDSFQIAVNVEASDNPLCYGFDAKINGPNDQDWYKVTLDATEPNLQVNLLELIGPMNIQLYDANGALLEQTTGTGTTDRTLTHDTSSGSTCYIHILHDSSVTDSTGCYRLQILKGSNPFRMQETNMDLKKELSITLYPNPANNEVTVRSFVSSDGFIEAYLFDRLGHRLINTKVAVNTGTNEWQFDLSGYSPGIYTLICRFGSQTISQHMVIVR